MKRYKEAKEMIKHILSITSIVCAILCAHGAKEKAEEESRLEKQNADAERKAKETAEEERRLARQDAEKKTQKDGGNSHKIFVMSRKLNLYPNDR